MIFRKETKMIEVWVIADDNEFCKLVEMDLDELNPTIEYFESIFDAQNHYGSPDYIFLDLGGILGPGFYGLGHSVKTEHGMIRRLHEAHPSAIIFIFSAIKYNAREVARELSDITILLDEQSPLKHIRWIEAMQSSRR